uniref:Polymerase (RNA) II (DNA directed) polypeptide M n=1 Tax=Iconisemion striatum TaxID=60296 RepID=A0A1A7XDD5_9TELE
MSSSWTERQGQVGDLRHQSKEELQDLLLRQEKILSNKRLLQTLPDKGNKIKDFVEKVRSAIEERREEERRQSLVSAARTELQSKYQRAFQQRAVSATSAASLQDKKHQDAASSATQDRETSCVSVHVQDNSALDQCVSRLAAVGAVGMAAAETPVDGTKEGEHIKALGGVTLSGAHESDDQISHRAKDNYFLRKRPPKKPHYVSVLEKTEASTSSRREKFKPNQPLHRNNVSPSGSLSPDQSSGTASPVSSQARREQDRKHLDDITAAKLPPLHHSPAKLLSLDESAILLREQTKKQQELQAKLAAQKLSEGLKVSMGSYTPDGGPMAAYREVHDEGAHLSSEDD